MAHPNPKVAATLPLGNDIEAKSPPANEASADHLAWLAAKARTDQPDRFRYLLLMRFALINVIGFGLFAFALLHGLVELVVVSDRTGLSVAIAVVFLAGLGICTRKVWQTSVDLNHANEFNPLTPSRAADYVAQLRGKQGESRSIMASAMRLRLAQRITVVRHVANSLVFLGLIGTVIGFIIALSGVDPANASDIKAVAPMVSRLVEGMSTALYTTLVGAVFSIWLMTGYQLLATGTAQLIAALVELGETHARP